jgi:RNA polymerase sigma-70 factor (ECF subfamily)
MRQAILNKNPAVQRLLQAGCQAGEFPWMHTTDWLIKECLQNNRAAQKQLYEQHAEAMLGLCYRYTKSRADAQDVLQEGFIRVFKNLHQYKHSGELGGWIRRVMVTTALNYLKRNAKYQHDLSFDKVELHPVSDENPGLKLDTKELASLIQQLPTGYQTIFNLFAVEGYTHVEIAAMLGISEGTSRSQYARARALLIVWIKKNYLGNKLQSYVK